MRIHSKQHADGRRRTVLRGVVLLCVVLLSASVARGATEAGVKAVLLLSFAQLSDWPGLSKDIEEFAICVYRSREFTEVLRVASEGEAIDGRPLVARVLESLSASAGCPMIFVPRAMTADYVADLRVAEHPPALVVGETPDFARRYGAIHLYLKEGRIGFEIDREEAVRSGAVLSSRILRRAELVGGADDG